MTDLDIMPYTPAREQAFRSLWLPRVQDTRGNAFARAPLSMLQDLYPQVWRYGPRGDTFHAQLTGIDRLLNSLPEDTERLNGLLQDMRPFINHFRTLGQTGHPQVNTLLAAEHRLPLPPLWIARSDYFFDIVLSDSLTYADQKVKNKGEDFLIVLGYLSLNRDLFLEAGEDTMVARYETYCDRWGIPA